MIKKILVTGGCGYVGSKLSQELINSNFLVKVLDLQIYGKNLSANKNLELIKGDIRDTELVKSISKDVDTVIHLACISNDPSFELNPELGRSINLDSFLPFLKICEANKVKKFIYASSSSVYGIKNIKNVSENESLKPITDYSRYKARCEEILMNSKSDMIKTILRPATVCGVSKRLRLDLVVNIITKHAFFDKKISIFGGMQLRPNIHINDMVDAYILLLNLPDKKIHNKIFNVGCENLSLNEIGEKVRLILNPNLKLHITTTDDNRSYHISSEKIKTELGFVPKRKVEDAINDLKIYFKKFDNKKNFNKDIFYNIKRMQNTNLQ
jgi:nucleoside-diphosphate-sugar epimerase